MVWESHGWLKAVVDSWLFMRSIQDLERDPMGEAEKAQRVIDDLVKERPGARVRVIWVDKGNWN